MRVAKYKVHSASRATRGREKGAQERIGNTQWTAPENPGTPSPAACYYPLLLLNHKGDRRARKLRPGNFHSAEGWEGTAAAEDERQQGSQGRKRGGLSEAALAKPELYEALEERDVKYVVFLLTTTLRGT